MYEHTRSMVARRSRARPASGTRRTPLHSGPLCALGSGALRLTCPARMTLSSFHRVALSHEAVTPAMDKGGCGPHSDKSSMLNRLQSEVNRYSTRRMDTPCKASMTCASEWHACHVSASSAPGSDSTAMSAARAGGVTRQKRSESCSTV